MAHELSHIQRHDNLLAAIHRVAATIFWFHPLLWCIGRRLLDEREAACDESVLEAGHSQQVYAESLLDVCRLNLVTYGAAAASGGELMQRIASIMSTRQVKPIDSGRCTLLLVAVSLMWFTPVFTGIVGGALRAEADDQVIRFDAVAAQLAEPNWGSSAHFDPAAGRITLKNVSLRNLIRAAYPWALVRGDPYVIDQLRYDIQARWQAQGTVPERALYRHLLRRLLPSHNVQLFVDRRCEVAC